MMQNYLVQSCSWQQLLRRNTKMRCLLKGLFDVLSLSHEQGWTQKQTYLASVGRGSSSSLSRVEQFTALLDKRPPARLLFYLVHWQHAVLGHLNDILAEGARALSVTLSGGALFASWKLFQFPSSLIVKVILAIFRRASAQRLDSFYIATCPFYLFSNN